MSDTTWTWLLFSMEIVGVFGMLCVGRLRWWGWVIVMLHSVPWFFYSITRDKPGFIAMSLLWWISHAYNALRWRRQRQQEALRKYQIDNGIWPWTSSGIACGTFRNMDGNREQ